jgi:hypothetical protein
MWRLRSAIDALKGAINEHSEAIRGTQAANRNPPTTVQTVNAVVSFDDETKRDTKTESNRQYRVQNSIRRAAWCAFGAAFIYAGIAAYQTHLTRKQMRDNTESFKTDERAWIELEPIKPVLLTQDPKFGATFTCNFYPKNVGKTVAKDIAVKAVDEMANEQFEDDAEGMRIAQDKLLPAQLKDAATNKLLFFNPVPKVLAPNTASPTPFRLTCQEPQTFHSGHQMRHYLVGRIDYCDQFRVNHWMKFCFYVVNGRGDIWACHEGNDEDKNSEDETRQTSCGKPN